MREFTDEQCSSLRRRVQPSFKLPHGIVTIRFGGRSRSPLRCVRAAAVGKKRFVLLSAATTRFAEVVGAILIARALTRSLAFLSS